MDLRDICEACWVEERRMLADYAQEKGDYVRCEDFLEEILYATEEDVEHSCGRQEE